MDFNSTSHPANDFRTFGFTVLRQFFDPRPLAAEIDQVLHDGLVAGVARTGATRFQYVPMMTAETPISLSLLDRLDAVAATLLGGSVLPTRAKAVRFSGHTSWHTDSALPLASVGCLAYLEPLGADDGALRVLPGSHHPDFGDALRGLGVDGRATPVLPAHVVVTEPGDLILLDEHLFHASFRGGTRRQWRVDFVNAPVDAEAEGLTKSYFAGIYPPDWDGGYDVDRYPSYGPDWRGSTRPGVAQLDALGVYELAAIQEAFTRSRR
ncbi:MAG: phytanoyl-CoA dioxygenase family protein [Blastocatellia bacterium]